MADSLRQWYGSLRVGEFLSHFPDLRIVPSPDERFLLRGTLQFQASGPKNEVISDEYSLELRVRPGFPDVLPQVFELGGRIPPWYHQFTSGQLCLGAPTEIRLRLRALPTLVKFAEQIIIPYLYGYSFFEKFGTMPYGELKHGNKGIRDHLRALFRVSAKRPEELLRLAGMKRRVANKRPCPCGSGRRLGCCHNRRVNQLRMQIGSPWFRAEYERVVAILVNDEEKTATLEIPENRPLLAASLL